MLDLVEGKLLLAFTSHVDALNLITLVLVVVARARSQKVVLLIFPNHECLIKANQDVSTLLINQHDLLVGNTFLVTDDAVVESLPHICVV
jgi:hypothetical protein